MKNLLAVQQKTRLDHLFAQAKFFEDELELLAHWARYLCVLSSGFVEVSVRSILSEYAKTKSAPYVANYVESRLNRFRSAKMQNLLELVGSFSAEWREQIASATEGEPKDAIDSIVNNRNQIAHGKNVTITYANIHQYYQNAVKVIELIEAQCDP